jgi:glutamate-1-semialdehyde 2,1-aminomutase
VYQAGTLSGNPLATAAGLAVLELFLAGHDAAGADLPEPTDYVTAKALAGNGVYSLFFHAMLRRGVALAPGPYEVMFPGLAHGDDVLNQVIEAAGEAAAEVSKELAHSAG